MKKADIDAFEKVQTQIQALHDEISALTKKSSNDAINEFKLKFINSILAEANKLLGTKYRPFPGFDVFDTEVFPSNSDTTFILAQYLNCMEKLRSDNIWNEFSAWYWSVDGNENKIRTAPPQKILKGR